MKQKVITLGAVIVLAFSGLAAVQARHQGRGGPRGEHRRGNMLDRMTENLNLTPEQKTKVQPILDQAKPQIRQIHEEAMQKTKAVMDNTMAQIRPLLTPEQQKKADELKKAHEDVRGAVKRLRDAKTS